MVHGSNLLCYSNEKYTSLKISKSKRSKDIKATTILSCYLGELVKYVTSAYNIIGLLEEYDTILKKWIRKWQNYFDKNTDIQEAKRVLLTRFEEKDREQILYFIHDFKLPFRNNQAEVDLRPVKIRQKIGKFRSEKGAEIHADIRSCINRFKKHELNTLDKITEAFSDAF